MDTINDTVDSGQGLGRLLLFLLAENARSAFISDGLSPFEEQLLQLLAVRSPGSQVHGVRSRLYCNLCCTLLRYLAGPGACSVL